MTKLLLDTHSLLWFAEKDAKLGKKTTAALIKAHASESLFISAISFWEIGMLVEKKRIALSRPVDFWRSDVIKAGIVEIPISGEAGLLATQLMWNHPDPADRIIVATSLLSNTTLVTADKIILRWRNELKRMDART